MTDLVHAIQFFQTGFTILLGLALGEAFKQFVPDGDQNIRDDRLPSLLAFLFMIFPFFHGMSRYFYTTYLTHADNRLAPVAIRVMFDGIAFMTLSVLFFIMSRSLSPSHWRRFYAFLLALLAVDSIWIAVSMLYGAPVLPWLILNGILAAVLVSVLVASWLGAWASSQNIPSAPSWICAVTTFFTSLADYIWMSGFYFP